MKIMVISGSARRTPLTRLLAEEVIRQLELQGSEVLMFDVGLNKLPLFTGDEKERENLEVARLMHYAEQADGFFICTPEYHSGISGALKNAIDYLGNRQFEGKPVAIAACSGGGKGGVNALNSLRLIMRSVYADVLTQQFIADPSDFYENKLFVSEAGRQRICNMVSSLVTIGSTNR